MISSIVFTFPRYVDEVQDNLLIDTLSMYFILVVLCHVANTQILVLRLLCHDENGLFWAGDTAQTISVGSSFRFNALKAFQWRLEASTESLTP